MKANKLYSLLWTFNVYFLPSTILPSLVLERAQEYSPASELLSLVFKYVKCSLPEKKIIIIIKMEITREATAQTILAELSCGHLPDMIKHCKSFGNFMPLNNRIIAQVLAFL